MSIEERTTKLNDAPIREGREYVLYWMVANRRVDWNFAMQRAVERAAALDKPLVVFEGLRCGYQWASDRLHRFVIDGMRDNRDRLADTHVTYFPWVETEEGAGKGLLAELAKHACLVVTDDFPAFMLPRMQAAAARQLDVLLERVDASGLIPFRATDKAYSRAHDFRRYLQKELPRYLDRGPKEHPLQGYSLPRLPKLPDPVTAKWPAASDALLDGAEGALDELPIDHSVGVVEDFPGGRAAALERLDRFMAEFDAYSKDRNHPDAEATSQLSAYLHFGYVSTHEILARIAEREEWTPDDVSESTKGSREGWWGMSEAAESYLDELVTWREVGFNMCAVRPDDYDDYESLPDWAKTTLAEHEDDPRPHLYTLEEFERAETHDPIWNAAQRQLVRQGRIHNYMRMLWGKKILHWTKSPREALDVMVHLNNKYALDGRDPNSYSGIFWVFGRYDRAWGPERDVFGKIRYMTSQSAKRKLRLNDYLERWS